ncbi:MAG TPA: alpha/beta hydrolase [Alphaproteobacteria bacterium]|nr:alpha/beta hydrolase [Alphaproteobacteria bacterium]
MTEYLKRRNLPDLAFVSTPATQKGAHLPTIMFLGGFRSDMEGTKALFLEEKCRARGQGYIRFDYRGHGQSEGKFEDACISDWTQDALDVLERCTSGPVILVGSSMGGWISLLLALKKPDRVQAMVGLAAAPDFTRIMEERMSNAQKEALNKEGFFELPNDYDDAPYIITRKLIEDGRRNFLLTGDIAINKPVRLIQGMKDADVEWQTAPRIKNALISEDVEVFLLEEADHRLSAPDQLAVLDQVINGLINE